MMPATMTDSQISSSMSGNAPGSIHGTLILCQLVALDSRPHSRDKRQIRLAVRNSGSDNSPGITILPELLRCLPTQGGSTYTPEQRWNAVLAWSITGSAAKASRICGVDAGTISAWRANSDWWAIFLEEARRQQAQEFDAALTGMVEKSISVAMQALDNPNISARDAAVIMGIAYDKRALHRGQATSRVERVNLSDLKAQFAKVIEGEASSNNMKGQTPSPNESGTYEARPINQELLGREKQ